MLYYYRCGSCLVCAPYPMPELEPTGAELKDGELLHYLLERPLAESRDAFCPGGLEELSGAPENVRWLDPARIGGMPPSCDATLRRALEQGRVRAVNAAHPRWKELLGPRPAGKKRRLSLLALGDVGSTLLMGLRLLGGDVLEEICICDIVPDVARRWEVEMEQIAYPWDYDRLPPVRVIEPEQLFDTDIFVFCASKGIPPVGSGVRDVRMAQLEQNAALVSQYARMARKKSYSGLFAVVSDPVDPLCRAAFLASNRDKNGAFDGKGLFSEQVCGFGLGVMNARAAYYAKKEARFSRFLTEGRSFGPHGGDLVIADSIERYDDEISRELTALTVQANLELRALGFKPYVAPAFSSGALSILMTLRGEWHCGSGALGEVFFGAKKRHTTAGIRFETQRLPDALFARIVHAADNLREIGRSL